MRGAVMAAAAVGLTVLFGCSPTGTSSDFAAPSATPSTQTSSASTPPPTAESAPSPSVTPSAATPATGAKRPPSPAKDVTYTKDPHYYSSPWYDGAWQEMIGFGCTNAPYYSRDPTCPRSKPGKHHGIDTYMPCGTKVRSAVTGLVVPHPDLGPAYGRLGLKIRSGKYDYVLGHVRRWYVRAGEHVRPGQLVARSGKLGAPDGCHLHFEKRPAGGSYTSAVNPLISLRRTIVRFLAR